MSNREQNRNEPSDSTAMPPLGTVKAADRVLGSFCLCAVLLFSSCLNSIGYLKQVFDKVCRQKKAFQQALLTPHSGMNILPLEVREIGFLLVKHPEIERIELSDGIRRNDFLFQRTVEGLWPQRFSPSASHSFILSEEIRMNAKWRIIDRGKGIALVAHD